MDIKGGVYKIGGLALPPEGNLIRDLRAEGVTLLGPAVVLRRGALKIENCGWNHPDGPEAVIIGIDDSRPSVAGAISLVNCEFINCQFFDIGMLAPWDEAQAFFENLTV